MARPALVVWPHRRSLHRTPHSGAASIATARHVTTYRLKRADPLDNAADGEGRQADRVAATGKQAPHGSVLRAVARDGLRRLSTGSHSDGYGSCEELLTLAYVRAKISAHEGG